MATIKVSGVHKTILDGAVKVDGVWKNFKEGYEKRNGSWHRIYLPVEVLTVPEGTSTFFLKDHVTITDRPVIYRVTMPATLVRYGVGCGFDAQGVHPGSTLELTVLGDIMGKGGRGADGTRLVFTPRPFVQCGLPNAYDWVPSRLERRDATDGYPAMKLGCKTIIKGNGRIAGGMRGGGVPTNTWTGGGGGGAPFGEGGLGGTLVGDDVLLICKDAWGFPSLEALDGHNATKDTGGLGGSAPNTGDERPAGSNGHQGGSLNDPNRWGSKIAPAIVKNGHSLEIATTVTVQGAIV